MVDLSRQKSENNYVFYYGQRQYGTYVGSFSFAPDDATRRRKISLSNMKNVRSFYTKKGKKNFFCFNFT